jgi:hypothetical protein
MKKVGRYPDDVDDRRVGDVASFLLLTVLANHTHLASYTRIVSLHRVSSRSTDYSVCFPEFIFIQMPNVKVRDRPTAGDPLP